MYKLLWPLGRLMDITITPEDWDYRFRRVYLLTLPLSLPVHVAFVLLLLLVVVVVLVILWVVMAVGAMWLKDKANDRCIT